MKHWFRNLFLLVLLLGTGIGGVSLWNYAEELAQPILVPLNASYQGYNTLPKRVPGLQLDPFTFNGYDGKVVQAVIVRRDGEESSRQLSILGNLATDPVTRLDSVDYVLICVDWDHGIRSALPLAESLTAAGLTCVLWEPRGGDSGRPYTTHGLKEKDDVPLLIDALTQRSTKTEPVIVAVGQGFGASLLLQAAAREKRISGLVCIDAYASLRQSVKRSMPSSTFTPLTMLLMDMKIRQTVGMESFDVAPVESAASIGRHVPVLVMNFVQDSPISNIDDAVTIFRRLSCEHKDIYALRTESDPAEAATRIVRRNEGSEEKARTVSVEVNLCKDEDAAITQVIHWMDSEVIDAVMAPRVINMPAKVTAGTPTRH